MSLEINIKIAKIYSIEKGLRYTDERSILLEAIENMHDYFTASDLKKEVEKICKSKKRKSLCISSIHNNIPFFEGAKIIEYIPTRGVVTKYKKL